VSIIFQDLGRNYNFALDIKEKTTVGALKAKIEERYVFKQDSNPPANSYFIFRRGVEEPLISIMKDGEVS
jgi:hypothetical protein